MKGRETLETILGMRQLMEKARKRNVPLYINFIYFEAYYT